MKETQQTQHTQQHDEHIWIEVTREGVIGVHADITDTPFLNLIGPAITSLDRTIRDVGRIINSKAFAKVMQDAATKLTEQATETDAAGATDTATSSI